MKVTDEDVRRMARLARLKLDARDLERMTRELNRIIAFIHELDDIDTAGVATDPESSDRSTPLRSDIPADFPRSTLILESAPVTESGFFSVPGVIEPHES